MFARSPSRSAPVVADAAAVEAPPDAQFANTNEVNAKPRRTRLRRALKALLAIVLVLVAAFAVVAYWALDRYVIDHVEVGDVAAYEASIGAGRIPTSFDAAPQTSPGVTNSRPSDTADAGGTAGASGSKAPASTSAATPATEPVITESTYRSAGTSIAISKITSGSGSNQVVYFVADVRAQRRHGISRSAFAQNKFGENIIDDTSDHRRGERRHTSPSTATTTAIAHRASSSATASLYRNDGARIGLAVYRDGTMKLYDETTTSAEALLAAGVWNTLSFGPASIIDGEIQRGSTDVEIDTNIGNHSIQGNQPRTGIGHDHRQPLVFRRCRRAQPRL